MRCHNVLNPLVALSKLQLYIKNYKCISHVILLDESTPLHLIISNSPLSNTLVLYWSTSIIVYFPHRVYL